MTMMTRALRARVAASLDDGVGDEDVDEQADDDDGRTGATGGARGWEPRVQAPAGANGGL